MLVKPSQLWSNLIKLGQTRFKLVLFGTGHYKKGPVNCLVTMFEEFIIIAIDPKSKKKKNNVYNKNLI